MKAIMEGTYKAVRTLPGGQRILIGTFENVGEAQERVTILSEYWPGDYLIEPVQAAGIPLFVHAP